MLGRLTPEEVARVVATVERYYEDPAAADDIRESAEIGRWEYETAETPQSDSAADWDAATRSGREYDV